MDLITIFTLVAVGAAAFSATMSWRAVKEMKRDRIERSQPTVIFDVDADPKGAYWCLLENVGPGIAYDVRISFDPVPNDYKGNPLSEWAWVAKSIPVFPPTKNKRQIFWSSQQYFNSQTFLPQFNVAVEYRGEEGVHRCHEFKIDFDVERGTQFPPKDLEYYSEKMAAALDQISNSLSTRNADK